MCNFDTKIWIFWAKSQFFCFGIAIFVNSAYHQYTRGYNYPIQSAPQKKSVSEIWVIFRGGPDGKVVAPGVLVICPVDKNRDSKIKK